MIKAHFLIVCLVVGATCQSTTTTPNPNNDPALIAIATNLVNALNTVLQDFLSAVDSGVIGLVIPLDLELFNQTIAILPGNLVLSAGLVALPTEFACNLPEPLSTLTCYIGSADCTFVHNKYGGYCGTVANPVNGTSQTAGEVFICNEQNPTGYNFASGPSSCGPIFNNTAIDNGIFTSIAYLTRDRYQAILCQYLLGVLVSDTGCISDCRNNHNYVSGTCSLNNTPVAVVPNERLIGQNCVCSGPHY